jgi:glutamate dehydrogenase
VQQLIDRYSPGVHALRAMGLEILSPVVRNSVAERITRFCAAGAPKALANRVAALRPLTTASHLVDLAQSSAFPIETVAKVYHQAGGAFGFDEVRAGAATLGLGDAFERSAVRSLVEDLVAEQTNLTARLLKASDGAPERAAVAFAERRREGVLAANRVLDEIAASPGGWTFAKLTIANSALRDLAEGEEA